MTGHTVHVTLIGTVRGRIWMPAIVCTKDVCHRFNMEADRFASTYTRGNWPGSLRDALLSDHVTGSGDFQSCTLDDGAVIKVTRYNPETRTERSRYWTIRGTIRPWQGRKPNRTLRRGYIRDCLGKRRVNWREAV